MSERGIDRVIGEWWAATDTLAALVPPDRLVAEIDAREEGEGRDDDEDGYFDETVIFDITTEPAWRTNSAQGWRSQVVLSCLSIDYEVSKQIGTAIVNAWANKGFSGSINTITACRPTGAITTTQDETTGVWETAVRFDMWHQGDV